MATHAGVVRFDDVRFVLFEDTAHSIWIGTADQGLLRYDGSRLEAVNVSHREIVCLAEDREGNVWAGTGGGGLNQLRPRPLELLGVEAGLPFESVRSVCEDAGGKLWVVMQNGLLTRHENAGWNTLSARTGWGGGHATCVTADREGALWIGTRDDGLHRFRDGKFQAWRKPNGLASDTVRSVLAASAGDVWIATDSPNRVQRLREGRFYDYELPQPSRSIRAMAEDGAGSVWFGTSDGQLWRVSDPVLVSEPAAIQDRPMSIRCLHATQDGSLWIGYVGWGIGRLKAGRLTRVETAHGLSETHISQILADDRGWLWFAGNRGIFQVRRQDLADAMEGKTERVRSIVGQARRLAGTGAPRAVQSAGTAALCPAPYTQPSSRRDKGREPGASPLRGTQPLVREPKQFARPGWGAGTPAALEGAWILRHSRRGGAGLESAGSWSCVH